MSRDAEVVQAIGLRRNVSRRLGLANHDELRIVDRVLQRLEVGRGRYGYLDLSRPRNWRKERFEERLDALVYDVAEELAAEDVERAALREDAGSELAAWRAHERAGADCDRVELAADLADEGPYVEYDVETADTEAG